MRFRQVSRLRLSLPFTLAALVALGALVGWTLYMRAEARRYAVTEAERSGARVAQSVAREQERLIESALQLLMGLAQRSEVQSLAAGRCNDVVASVLKAFPVYVDVIVAKPSGEAVCAGRAPEASSALVDRADVGRSVQTGNTTLGRYRIDGASGTATVTLTAPSVDDAGVVRAVVVVALDLTWLSRTLRETPLMDGASLVVVDRRGTILTHYPEPERHVVIEEPIMHVVLAQGDGTAEGLGVDGVPSVFAFAPLLRDSERAGDATVIVAMPKHAIFREADRLFSAHLGGLAIVALALMVAAGLGADFLVGRPAHTLTQALRRLSAGDVRSRPLALARSRGAFGRLARTLDAVARRLELRQREAALLEKKLAAARAAAPKPAEAIAPVAEPPRPQEAVEPERAEGAEPRPWRVAPASEPAATGESSRPGSSSFEAYWGLAQAPFENSPNPRFLYLAPDHLDALRRLDYGVRQRRGCVVLTGEPGCGKTTLIRALISDLEPERYEIGLLTRPIGDSVGSLLRDALYELGVETRERRRPELLHMLNDLLLKNYKNGLETLIVADDVQLVDDPKWLEEISLLLNFQANEQSLLAIVLAGTPELLPKVRAVKHLDQRIAVRCQVRPLDETQAGKYICHRLQVAGRAEPTFTPEAVKLIHEATHGRPRQINNVCDSALMLGCLGGRRVIDEEIIRSVLKDMALPQGSESPKGTEAAEPLLRPVRGIVRPLESGLRRPSSDA